MKKQLTKFAQVATFGLALTFTQVTVFAQPQYQYQPQYQPQQAAPPPVQPQYQPQQAAPPPAQPQYQPQQAAQPLAQPQYQPPQEQYQYPPQQEQYLYQPPQEQYPVQPVAPTQAGIRKNSIALDMFTLFKGAIASNEDFTDVSISAAYERLMAPHFSIGPDLEMYFMSYDKLNYMHFYFSLAAEGRYYTDADFEKFFVGTIIGFNLLSVDGKTGMKYGGFAGLTSSLKMGYKVTFSELFYMEPSMSWVLSKSASVPTPSGWQGGLRVGCSF